MGERPLLPAQSHGPRGCHCTTHTYCHIPTAWPERGSTSVTSSILEEHNTIWYLCHHYTIDIKDVLVSFTIERTPGSTHLQSTTCLKVVLVTEIKRLETIRSTAQALCTISVHSESQALRCLAGNFLPVPRQR